MEKKRKKGNEKLLQDKLINFVKLNGYLYYKTWGGTAGGSNGVSYSLVSGWPDVIILDKKTNNHFIMVELKDTNGDFTASQVTKFKNIISQGHDIYLLKPEYWDKVKETSRKNENDLFYAIDNVLPKITLEDIDKRYQQLFKKYGETLKPKRIK